MEKCDFIDDLGILCLSVFDNIIPPQYSLSPNCFNPNIKNRSLPHSNTANHITMFCLHWLQNWRGFCVTSVETSILTGCLQVIKEPLARTWHSHSSTVLQILLQPSPTKWAFIYFLFRGDCIISFLKLLMGSWFRETLEHFSVPKGGLQEGWRGKVSQKW